MTDTLVPPLYIFTTNNKVDQFGLSAVNVALAPLEARA